MRSGRPSGCRVGQGLLDGSEAKIYGGWHREPLPARPLRGEAGHRRPAAPVLQGRLRSKNLCAARGAFTLPRRLFLVGPCPRHPPGRRLNAPGGRACNRYAGEMEMRDGLPVTRGDPQFHGFGTKSIVAIYPAPGSRCSPWNRKCRWSAPSRPGPRGSPGRCGRWRGSGGACRGSAAAGLPALWAQAEAGPEYGPGPALPAAPGGGGGAGGGGAVL